MTFFSFLEGEARFLLFIPTFSRGRLLTCSLEVVNERKEGHLMSIRQDWMDARSPWEKRALFMRAGVRGLLLFLFLWGKERLAHLQVESVLGQVG